MSFSIILYVWQNIEMVKIDMDVRKTQNIEKRLVKDNDRLRYELERYKKIDVVEARARERGYKEIGPGDFDVLIVKDSNGE